MNIIIKKVLSVIMFCCLGSSSLVICMGGLQVAPVAQGVNNVAAPNDGQAGMIRQLIIGGIVAYAAKLVAVVGLNYLLNKNTYYHKNIDPTVKRWSLFLGNGKLLDFSIIAPFLILLPFAIRPLAGV